MSKLSFKIGIFGSGGVGKTCISLQFVKGEFTEGYIPTIEDEFQKTFDVDGQMIELEIIDTAGQDEFQEMGNRYMSLVDGFIFVYSVTEKSSLSQCEDFILRAIECKKTAKKPFGAIIAGNKCDVECTDRVSFEEGKALADKYKCQILETSAKTSKNINELFVDIIKIVKDSPKNVEADPEPGCKCNVA